MKHLGAALCTPGAALHAHCCNPIWSIPATASIASNPLPPSCSLFSHQPAVSKRSRAAGREERCRVRTGAALEPNAALRESGAVTPLTRRAREVDRGCSCNLTNVLACHSGHSAADGHGVHARGWLKASSPPCATRAPARANVKSLRW